MKTQQIKLLIESAKQHHIPIFTTGTYGIDGSQLRPWCCGCDGLVLITECPVLQAAKEMEKECGN